MIQNAIVAFFYVNISVISPLEYNEITHVDEIRRSTLWGMKSSQLMTVSMKS